MKTKIFDTLLDKIDIKIVINVIYFFCLFVILLPTKTIKSLKLFDFKQKHTTLFGIIILLITAYYATIIIMIAYKKIKARFKIKRELNYKTKLFETLSKEERSYLNRFYDSKMKQLNNSAAFEANDGTVTLLEHKGIIVRGSNISLSGTLFSYILQPWAYEIYENQLKEKNKIKN